MRWGVCKAAEGGAKTECPAPGPIVFLEDRAALLRTERPNTRQGVSNQDRLSQYRTECLAPGQTVPPPGPELRGRRRSTRFPPPSCPPPIPTHHPAQGGGTLRRRIFA